MEAHAGLVWITLSTVHTRGISFLLLLSLISSVAVFADAVNPQLTLDPVNVRQDGVVTFSTLSLGVESHSDLSEKRYILGQTDDQNFRLWVDTESIQQVRFNAFTFAGYVADARDATQKTYKFQITANPTGLFRDVSTKVSFHVKTSASSYSGSIHIPVYNASKTDVLLTEKQGEPAYVSVSGATQIQIPLRNVAESLPVNLTDVAVSEDCRKCWMHISSAVSEKAPFVLNPGTNGRLAIDLAPNTIPALLQGALVISGD
jgi:hypothetical protein